MNLIDRMLGYASSLEKALGDACASAALCRTAIDHQVLEGLMAVVAVQTNAVAFRANAAWTISQLYVKGDPKTRDRLQRSGAAAACDLLLKEKATSAHLGQAKLKMVQANLAGMLKEAADELTQFV